MKRIEFQIHWFGQAANIVEDSFVRVKKVANNAVRDIDGQIAHSEQKTIGSPAIYLCYWNKNHENNC